MDGDEGLVAVAEALQLSDELGLGLSSGPHLAINLVPRDVVDVVLGLVLGVELRDAGPDGDLHVVLLNVLHKLAESAVDMPVVAEIRRERGPLFKAAGGLLLEVVEALALLGDDLTLALHHCSGGGWLDAARPHPI